MERERKEKRKARERERKKKRKIIHFEGFGYREEGKEIITWEFYFYCLFVKGKERKKSIFFTFVPLLMM